MQETCVRLMGKKLLVSLAMEGKFANDGLQAIDEGDDILMAMARELVTEKGIGGIGRCRVEAAPEAAGGSVRNPPCGNFPMRKPNSNLRPEICRKSSFLRQRRSRKL